MPPTRTGEIELSRKFGRERSLALTLICRRNCGSNLSKLHILLEKVAHSAQIVRGDYFAIPTPAASISKC